MILTDNEILKSIETGSIIITPFDRNCLGSNSYDVHLSENLAEYTSKDWQGLEDVVLDSKLHNKIRRYKIPENGITLFPGRLYLGTTKEYTETLNEVPMIDGKSSTGRLGINIHATAGKGDVGFKGHFTLEISVILPVIVYAGMPIGQIYFLKTYGVVVEKYCDKKSAKYINNSDEPMESMMFKNFQK